MGTSPDVPMCHRRWVDLWDVAFGAAEVKAPLVAAANTAPSAKKKGRK